MTARFWRQLVRAPALRAALAQVLAVPATLCALRLLAGLGVAAPAPAVALLQGACAALLGYGLRLAVWWRLIGLLFPLALLGADALRLPPALFLAGFLFLLGLYWSTFRTQVPFYPSGPAVWQAVAQLLPERAGLRLIDIGSGLGGLALALARRRPDCAVAGVELAPLPWLLSRLRARLAGSAARFLRGDYDALDFGAYDVVFAYLSPAAMAALWRKASAEMRPGAILLSYEFSVPERAPDRVVPVRPGAPALYVWYF